MEQKKGILMGVGVGPGDPQLMTLAAVDAIAACNVVAVPVSGGERILALDIAGEHAAGKPLLKLPMPMTRDMDERARAHDAAADTVCARLDAGEDVAFLTLGDPGVYATYAYLHERVAARGYATRIVPGVTSFCAAAAALGQILCVNEQPLHILPWSRDTQAEALDLPGPKVVMKAGKGLDDLLGALCERELLGKAALAERCGLPGERLVPNLEQYAGGGEYFVTVLVKE